VKVGSLFAGIGGFDLAARWVGWETSWYSEIEPYASAVMQKQFPEAVNLGDVTLIDGKQAAPVDILCGGFPCQDISLAGKGAGLSGARSGLWTHYARLIDEIRPRWVVAENVSALRSRGLDQVLGSLDALGYDAEWHCIPAAHVGAPHRRDRIWIIAYPRIAGGLADGLGAGLEGHAGDGGAAGREAASGSAAESSVRGGGYTSGWWASEPNVGRVAHGIPSRVDRLRCLGNSIVPQVAYEIFRAIDQHERNRQAGLRTNE
jgi:DNA (cytosine-5)-methyltransferase 1